MNSPATDPQAPPGLTIRRAEREDAQGLVGLITELAYYEKLPPPEPSAISRLIEHGWGERPKFDAWIVACAGDPVGYAIAFETYSTFLMRPTLYLEDIFVLPAYRRRGIGGAIFDFLLNEAKERGCGRVEWACLQWNEPALEFYLRQGAQPLDEWRYFRLLVGDSE